MAKVKPSELKSMLQQVQSCLNLIAETDDATFEKSWGVSRNQALRNLAKLCGDTLDGKPAEGMGTFTPPSKAELIRDDFQISGISDARDESRTFEGWKVSDLRAMFDCIAPKDDWKAPIDTWIDQGEFTIASAAVRFFTSTELTITVRLRDRIRVQADGYRAGPAGDR